MSSGYRVRFGPFWVSHTFKAPRRRTNPRPEWMRWIDRTMWGALITVALLLVAVAVFG
jgi:hypothetical protein